MKRIISFIVILSMMALAVGCSPKMEPSFNHDESPSAQLPESTDNPYRVRTAGASDSVLLATHGIEFSLWGDILYQDESAPREIDITFDDVEYHGEYHSTGMFNYNYYPIHCYLSGETVIRIDPNGELVQIAPYLKDDPLLEQTLTQTQCEEIANEYFATMTEHSEEYIHDKETRDVPQHNAYTIYFTKYVDGWKTADFARITVDADRGKINEIVTTMFGRFDVDEKIPFDRALVEEAVDARVKELISQTSFVNFEYIEVDYIVTKISPTEYAVVCELQLRCYYENGSYMHRGIKFVVTE